MLTSPRLSSIMIVTALLGCADAARADEHSYIVDLGAQSDFEVLRPLIDGCSDIGELERYRSAIDSVSDLEDLRAILERQGVVEFRGCPDIDTDAAERRSRSQ